MSNRAKTDAVTQDLRTETLSPKRGENVLNLKIEGPKFNQFIYMLVINKVSNFIAIAAAFFENLC